MDKQSGVCEATYVEHQRDRLVRLVDSDPEWYEWDLVFRCGRAVGHGGDHHGPNDYGHHRGPFEWDHPASFITWPR
jgi:hypothetical protein